MRTKILCVCSVLGLLVGFGGSAFADETTMETLVEQYLQQLGAEHYFLDPVKNRFVERTFPNFAFMGVYFQQYPVAVEPPPGLAESNVFFMNRATKEIGYATGPDDLLAFFRTAWDPFVSVTGSKGPLADAAKTWLRLSQEFSQDGFYQFSKPAVVVEGNTAYGMVTVEQGGTGYLAIIMTIGPQGELSVAEERDIRPGSRPI